MSMAVNSIEISAGGRWVKVPALDFRGRSVTVKGGLVKIAAIHDEWWLESEIEIQNHRLAGKRIV